MLSRRLLLRTAAVGTAGLALAGRSDGALAGRVWCRVEPLIRVNGRLVDLWVAGEDGTLAASTGPIQMTCYVPVGAAVEYLSADDGFGFGYAFGFAEDASLKITQRGNTRIRVETFAPASAQLRIQVEVQDVESGQLVRSSNGRTNQLETTRARV